jgi:exopolysaccharide production protein ExoZ
VEHDFNPPQSPGAIKKNRKGEIAMLNNLQGLRAYAALSVALFHFSLVPASAMPWHYGSFGVDLFFVLSGFIIAYSADRNSRNFLAHRLIRVLPTYWVTTTIGAAICALGMPFIAVLGWYGQSLFFLTSPEGRPPINFVGWTLVYELAFYLLYALVLMMNRKAAPILAIVLLAIVAFALPLVPMPHSGAAMVLRPWPLLIEFVYGLTIFLITKSFRTEGAARRYSGLVLAAIGIGLLYYFDPLLLGKEGIEAQFHRVVMFGLPAALTVFGLVMAEKAGASLKNRFVLALGASSYAIYLIHPLVFFIVFTMKAGPFETQAKIFATLTVATVLLSLGFYYAIEAPFLRWARRHLTHDAAPRTQA